MDIARDRTALLVMDYQKGVVAMLGDKAAPFIERTAALIAAARAASVRVIYVVVGFRPGFPEISPRNQGFSTIKQSGRFDDPSVSDVIDAVRPTDHEPTVTKRRVGPFGGTDLEVILRSQGIETLVLAGISTSGVVLSTVRHASDADYRLIIASDCCADTDQEVHTVLMTKVFPRQATVTTSDELIATLRA
jgi:nicotinamidase-related amidase